MLVPLGFLAGESKKLAPHAAGPGPGAGGVRVRRGGSAIYLVVVLGLGHAPKTTGDKEVLALPWWPPGWQP